MSELIYHDLEQGSDEWLHFRSQHDGASEAAAMLGLSKKTSRTELLNLKHTGITKEFSDYVQREILDYGHEVEAMARPIVAARIGKKLYPVTISRGGRMSASCDGMAMDETVGWEHKQYNKALFDAVSAGDLPDEYMPQVQQELMLSGAQKWVFTVSDGTADNMASMDVLPDQEWFDHITAGWEQFHKDLAEYTPKVFKEKPAADVTMELPALFIQARGEITLNNMEEFGAAITHKLAEVRAIKLVTDQDFSNAEKAAKDFRATCEKLKLVKTQMLDQTVTIGEAAKMIDAWHEDLRITALQLEKDVKAEKDAKQVAIVMNAKAAYAEHIVELEKTIAPIRLNMPVPDFALAMKGKRLLSAWHDAVDTCLSQAKSSASVVAQDIVIKKMLFKREADGYEFLFSDIAQIITKPHDDFKLVIESRIVKHKADEAARIEAETARIRAEEEAKAQAKAKAEQDAIVAKAQAEERAKVEAEQRAIAESNRIYEAACVAQAKLDDAAKVEKETLKQIPVPPDVVNGRIVSDSVVTLRPPSKGTIILAVAEYFDISPDTAEAWLVAEFSGVTA